MERSGDTVPRNVKPLDELSPAYRARIERGLEAGLSRAQARGHPGVRDAPASLLQALKGGDVEHIAASVQNPKGKPSERVLRVTVTAADGTSKTWTMDVRAKDQLAKKLDDEDLPDAEGTP